MAKAVSEARSLAYHALERVRRDGAFANEVIDRLVDTSDASPEDRAFATRIVLGVVATSGSLDSVIRRFADRGSGIKGKLRTALRICAYEVLYLGKDPYAAVDQCVELVKTVQPRAAGLANAVMRKIAASVADFPYGDPSTDMDAYCLKHAFPEWLVCMARNEYGDAGADEFVRASNSPSPIYVHISSLNDGGASAAELHELDKEIEEVQIHGVVVDGCLKLSSSRVVASRAFLDMVDRGDVLVSDASAQLIAQLACESVVDKWATGTLSCLELCAGRGTKTILLQDQMLRSSGRQFSRLVALDNMEFKTKMLASRAKTYGAHVDETVCADASRLDEVLENEIFDLVFLDAPCSGLGTMRRHPEIRWRATLEIVSENGEHDIDLLRSASRHVGKGGLLVYSTCTISHEENEDAIWSFLSTEEGSLFEPLPVLGAPFLRTMLREGGYDAHFCAMLRRKELR